MTEAGWTREKPTAAGWYWYRSINDEQTESVVWVAPNMGVFSAFYHSRVEHLDGEWLGPISPDSYRQGRVAGIKQGIEKLREREKFYTEQEAISEGQMRLTRGLQRNESSGCIHELEKLAQQAQDEKEVGDGKVQSERV